MRHAGLALAVLFLASVQAMAAAAVHQTANGHNGAGHPGGAHFGGAIHLAGGRTPPAEHECFSAAQTREKIAAHKLADPFRLLVSMAGRYDADPLGVRLCRHKEQYVYEINLLRVNGRVVHVFTNALTGQVLSAKNAK